MHKKEVNFKSFKEMGESLDHKRYMQMNPK